MVQHGDARDDDEAGAVELTGLLRRARIRELVLRRVGGIVTAAESAGNAQPRRDETDAVETAIRRDRACSPAPSRICTVLYGLRRRGGCPAEVVCEMAR